MSLRKRPTALAIAREPATPSPQEDLSYHHPALLVGTISPGFPTSLPDHRARARAVIRRPSLGPEYIALRRHEKLSPVADTFTNPRRIDALPMPPPGAPPRVAPGTLVAFSLSADVLRTLAPPGQPDIVPARVLGLVYAVNPVEREWMGEELFIAFVARFPPGRGEAARSARGMIPRAEHCIPIASYASGSQTASTREPLSSVVRFPYGGACAWTTVGVRAHVNDVWPVAGPPVVIGDADVERFRRCLGEDLRAQAEAGAGAGQPDARAEHTTPVLGGITQLHESLSVDVWFDVNVAGPDADPERFYRDEDELNACVPRCLSSQLTCLQDLAQGRAARGQSRRRL